MRNLFIILTLTTSLPVFTQSLFDHPIKILEPVDLIATYSLKYQLDSLDSNFIRQEDMLLFLGQNTSKFLGNDLYVFDTIMKRVSSTAELQALLSDKNNPLPLSGFNYKIFKIYPKTKLTYLDYLIGNSFKYEETLNLFNWQLTEDTATIAGYKTQKATTDFGGRSWIAWFSPELPFNDGPYKFNGLPGLIVKIFDTRMHYVFEMVSIEKPRQKLMIDYKEKDFIEVNKQEFFKAEDAFYRNLINRMKDAGLPSESQQKVARRMSERNNLIELKRK